MNGFRGEICEARECVRFVDDLKREFPRRCKDECPCGAPRLVDQTVEHWKQKCRRLPATRRRAREYVSSGKGKGDGFRLDGRGVGEAQGIDPFDEGLVQLQSGERQGVVRIETPCRPTVQTSAARVGGRGIGTESLPPGGSSKKASSSKRYCNATQQEVPTVLERKVARYSSVALSHLRERLHS